MFGGLPGTGITAILYAILAVASVPRWLWRRAKGRARRGEGRAVAQAVVLVAGVAAMLTAEWWWIWTQLSKARESNGPIARLLPEPEVTASYAMPIAFSGLVVLAFVLVTVEVTALLVRRRPTALRPAEAGPLASASKHLLAPDDTSESATAD